MEFTCECCHYVTTVKCNYAKHLASNKHIIQKHKQTTAYKADVSKGSENKQKVIPEPTITIPESTPKDGIFCKYCDKSFTFKQSMYRHIKYSCTKNKDEDLKELVRLMNLKMESMRKELQSENKELQKQLDQKSKQIEKLMGKLEINGSFNNNTINNITLLAYRNTDVSHLTTEANYTSPRDYYLQRIRWLNRH